MSQNDLVTRRTGVIAFFTLLSRFAGLARDAVVAFFFGTSMAADAFYMAFTIPNLLRRFTAEGALTIAFVPIFTAEKKRSEEGAKLLLNAAFSYQLVFLILVTGVGICGAPALLRLIASGFQSDASKFALTVDLTRLLFPYIIFVSLAALVMGVLNSCKKFAAPAYAPIFLNIGLIVGAVFSSRFDPPVYGLAAGVLFGGLMHLLAQIPDLRRLGYRPKISFKPHPELKSLLGLMLPAAYGAAFYQINVVVIRFFASFLPEGAVSYLWYGNRIYEFPIGVFAIALATALQPTLSDFAAEKNWDRFKETLAYGMRLSLFISLPAMFGLAVLSEPIIRVLLERGIFDASATHATATALSLFTIGLPFLALARLLVPAFYALQDAKKPVLLASVAVGVNVLSAWLLVGPLHHNGLALAVTISSAVNAVLLLFVLRLKIGLLGLRKTVLSAARSFLVSGVMGGILFYGIQSGFLLSPDQSKWVQLLHLLCAVFGGLLFYLVFTRLCGADESKELLRFLLRKRAGR